MLLYFINHSRPDIVNLTQELSNVKYGVNQAAYLKIHHVIKYMFDTRNFGINLEPSRNDKVPWDILCFSDSDYARGQVSRRSVSRFISYVLGVSVSC